MDINNHKQLNRWLDELFASAHSELQFQIGILPITIPTTIFDALATNDAYCRLEHDMSIPHIFAINHDSINSFSVVSADFENNEKYLHFVGAGFSARLRMTIS